jgi:hypothetical protein
MRVRATGIIAAGMLAATAEASHADGPLSSIGVWWRDMVDQAASFGAPQSAQSQAATAVRDVVRISSRTSIARLGGQHGFLKDERARIRLPGRLGEAQAALGPLGQSGPLDELERRVNVAASLALPIIEPEVLAAARTLTVSDGLAVVRGDADAATLLLKQCCEIELREALRPNVEAALATSGAFDALPPAAAAAGSGASSRDLREDLADYVLKSTVAAFFVSMAAAEADIRRNPSRYNSESVQRAFAKQS